MADGNTSTGDLSAPANASLMEQDVAAVFNFDPFPGGTPAPEVTQPPVTQPPVDGGQPQVTQQPPTVTQQPPTATAAPAGGPEPTQAPATDPKDAELQLLRQTVEQLAQPAGTEPPTGDEPKGPKIPDYQYEIPEPLLTGLRSEDPAEQKKAVGNLLTGVSQTVHMQVLQQVAETFNQVVPRMILGTLAQAKVSENVKEDFYGKNPDLNDPQFYPIIQTVAMQAMQELKTQQWSPQLRDVIESRARVLLNRPRPQPQQQPTPTAAPAQAPYMSDTTSRPAAPQGGGGDIFDTLFG